MAKKKEGLKTERGPCEQWRRCADGTREYRRWFQATKVGNNAQVAEDVGNMAQVQKV